MLDKLQPGRALRMLAALFPPVAESDFQAVLAILPVDMAEQLSVKGQNVRLITIAWRGSSLVLPYRVYLPEPATEQVSGLTSGQRQVLHCLYLRHHNGYVRQRHLEALFALGAGEPADFTTPFTFSLLGEYVQEILEVLTQHLTPALEASYVQLIRENPLYWQQTQGRVASYWDCYYRIRKRGAPRFRHYVGARLLARLQQACRLAAEK
ncbi:hypothetical protein GCM10023172_16900 [Hymenobacter ginsengisoli]|uniref:Uncharacterized protein n=1 Tax=Hymenobacter ginsengisoli TaxID=1051626 RepID=A0ABP8Q815_9BACT|nr:MULTISPECIES: hypothetical protein [unclassified Hymenobacter]MBO2030766.1 hypothetical protein [Hymenobacter sp. BT559]